MNKDHDNKTISNNDIINAITPPHHQHPTQTVTRLDANNDCRVPNGRGPKERGFQGRGSLRSTTYSQQRTPPRPSDQRRVIEVPKDEVVDIYGDTIF